MIWKVKDDLSIMFICFFIFLSARSRIGGGFLKPIDFGGKKHGAQFDSQIPPTCMYKLPPVEVSSFELVNLGYPVTVNIAMWKPTRNGGHVAFQTSSTLCASTSSSARNPKDQCVIISFWLKTPCFQGFSFVFLVSG